MRHFVKSVIRSCSLIHCACYCSKSPSQKVRGTWYNAFNKKLPTMRFKARISVAINTKKKWFDLPKKNTQVDLWGIGKKVFIDTVSKKKYDEMNELYGFYESSSDDECDYGNQHVIADAIAEMTKVLEEIETVINLCL